MTKNQFDKLTGEELVQPNDDTHNAFNIETIDKEQGLILIKRQLQFNQIIPSFTDEWYRYENISIVKELTGYKRVNDNFNILFILVVIFLFITFAAIFISSLS